MLYRADHCKGEHRADMKILMINHFPLTGSGSGTYTRNLAVHLAALGNEVTVILPENTDHFERVEGVRLHPVYFLAAYDDGVPEEVRRAGSGDVPEDVMPGKNYPGDSMDMALPFNFPCFTTHPRSTVSFGDLTPEQLEMYKDAFTRAIDEEVERDRPDVIHGQHVWILPSLAAGKGVPIVLTAHGTDLMGYDKWPHLREYADRVMAECRSVISISKDNCELIRERFPYAADKIVMMRNGYDPSIFYPENDSREEVLAKYGITPEDLRERKLVCFAGKLTRFKGVDILLDSLKRVEEMEKVFTIIAGDGEEREHLREQAARLGLDKTVRFLGNVDMNTLRKLYNISDVSVVPSRREPFGLVALEAMACGVPVVASDQGGLPDFVNNDVGALARPEDPEDLADKILIVLARAGSGSDGAADNHTARAGSGSDGADEEPAAGTVRAGLDLRSIAKYARRHYAQDTIISELVDVYRKAVDFSRVLR